MKTLIIDPAKVFQQLIADVLEGYGIEHAFASTGKESLRLLKKEQFDCICLAMYLDDMDGIQLSQEIRKLPQYKHIPVVLLTSDNNNDVTKSAIRAGITDIFIKEKVYELVNFIERFTQIDKPLSGKILYIEDQKSQRDLVTAMFTNRKLQVDAFDNAKDAWDAFLKNHYHLIVTDLVLGGEISGVLLINKIRRLEDSKGDTPILAVTAFDDNSRRISLYHMGITDYVTKPIIEEELIARVRNLISNQKALEREIHFREHMNSEEMTRHNMKMEALGKLTGGIAHDYNNMLGVIIGYTDLLANKIGDQPQLQRYVEQIHKASSNGALLTEKLLSFTRHKISTADIVNINQLVTDAKPMLEKVLTAGIFLKTNLEEGLWNIFADSNDLENTLLNMCINAKHAMGEKGSLTIATMNIALVRDFADKMGLVTGDYVKLSILDTGSGMDSQTKARIFDPFFSTKGEGGTGLGLSQAYGFIQRSKGSITVESKPGKGTLFNLYFPRYDGEAQLKNESEYNNNISTQGKGYSVLVVDDNQVLAELTTEILLSAGYKTSMAVDAREALNQFKLQKFDVMITDIIMPNLNGYELALKVKSMYPEVKIIITSGYSEEVKHEVNNEELFKYYLEKPVTRDQLLKCVKEILKS